ncbi:MAG: small-conductance mechanosensitive channel [Alphaproteobacteria bacterium]|jgi:small-conductance mechanosensitive channel
MSMFETKHPELHKLIEQVVEYLPFLDAYQNKLSLMAPALIQISAVIATFLIAFSFVKSVRKREPVKKAQFIPFLQKLSWETYSLFALMLARTFFMIAEFETTWLDAAIVLTAIRSIPHIVNLSPLEKSSRKKVIITAWVVLALMLTQNISPVINFLDSAKFTVGESTVSPWVVIKAILMFTLLMTAVSKGTKFIEKHFLKGNRKFSPSARTLIVKVSNILGLVIAFLITLDIIGIDLAAFAFFGGALGIGIGFGLQKIVGNLISGMILIIDKSIKPGDVISMGESYGVITALHARYAVMRRRDGMEVLIPNEMLMTNEVTNWSFNNKNVRVVIKVGVSYDSDLEQVQNILTEIAKDNELVMKDPSPRALVTSFGDSSIDFEVRFWLDNPEDGLGNVRSQMYIEIWKRFKAEGIEIPFPQRVLHTQGTT